MRIGILTIATGKYIDFVSPLWGSIAAKFLPGIEKHYFLWTDHVEEKLGSLNCFLGETTHIERGGFPLDTLKRYHYFLMQEERLRQMDFLFYFDADMLVHSPVTTDGDLAPLLDGRVNFAFTMHPGFTWNGQMGTFETSTGSCAYVPPPARRRKPYVAGGFNGGSSREFLRMAEHIAQNVDIDAERGVTAIWHDESHLNHYHATHTALVLHPGYCYPESWSLPFHKYIVALDKNHEEVRQP